jgi:hypothetical protein
MPKCEVIEARRSRSRPDRCLVRTRVRVVKQDTTVALTYTPLRMVKCRDKSGSGWRSSPKTDTRRLAMPKIVDIQPYDGFDRKVERLGLTGVLNEVRERISAFLLAETRRGNSAAACDCSRMDDC